MAKIFLTIIILFAAIYPALSQDFPRPAGIYALGPGALQPIEDRLNGIRDYPFVDGYALRLKWRDLEIGPETYDFSPVDSAIARLERLGQKLTLSLFATVPPEDVLSAPGAETYLGVGSRSGGSRDELRPVTWDSLALWRWELFARALSEHQAPGIADGGQKIPLNKHPALAQISASIVGLGSVRDKEGRLVSAEGYEREKFVKAAIRSLHAITDVFSEKFTFVGFFRMNDQINSPALDAVLLDSIVTEFDGIRNSRVGLFQESLACATPVPTFAWALDREKDNTFILFQMLQAWKSPFSDPAKTDPCLSDSTGPDVGIEYALNTYNCRYFEVYAADLDWRGFWPAFEKWQAILNDANPTSVSENGAVGPQSVQLLQNYPNPFNPSTTITYNVPAQSRVILKIYDVRGREIRTLVDHTEPPGTHFVVWDGKDRAGKQAPSGAYFYLIRSGEFHKTRKAILVK